MSSNFTVKFRFVYGFSYDEQLVDYVCRFSESFLFNSNSDDLGYYCISFKTLRAAKRFVDYLYFHFQHWFWLRDICIYSASGSYCLQVFFGYNAKKHFRTLRYVKVKC